MNSSRQPTAHPLDPAAAPAPFGIELSSEILGRLRAGRLKVTPVRASMLTAMLRHAAPLTLRELQAGTRPAPFAFATLFRCMVRFEQIDLVRRTIDLAGVVRWEFNPGRPRDFCVTCRKTGRVTGLDPESARELRRLLDRLDLRLRERGYSHLQLHVAFHGSASAASIGHAENGSRQRVA